jgi:hypothetical protein
MNFAMYIIKLAFTNIVQDYGSLVKVLGLCEMVQLIIFE